MTISVPNAVLEKIARYQKDGRGEGSGKDYKPWVRVQDFYSFGKPVRWWSHKLQRMIETMSGQETVCGRLLVCGEAVEDLNEQIPCLPIEDTLEIADELGVSHPMEDGLPKVITSDFRLKIQVAGKSVAVIREYKPTAFLNDRNLEKLEIGRRFWHRHGISDWGLITDQDLPEIERHNIEFLSGPTKEGDIPGLQKIDPAPYLNLLRKEILARREVPVCRLCAAVDEKMGHHSDPRTLALLNQAFASGHWPLDLHIRYDPTEPLHQNNVSLIQKIKNP